MLRSLALAFAATAAAAAETGKTIPVRKRVPNAWVTKKKFIRESAGI